MTIAITDRTLALFIEYAKDAGNWSGTPLIGGNVGSETSKEDRGNITQMKVAGLVTTFEDSERGMPKCYWLQFTEAGKALAKEHGVDLSWI